MELIKMNSDQNVDYYKYIVIFVLRSKYNNEE